MENNLPPNNNNAYNTWYTKNMWVVNINKLK